MNKLNRFLEAQAKMYNTALNELKRGCKESHWIWFIFPQLKGLGVSDTAKYYDINDLEEAKAYLAHPILSQRLKEATRAILDLQIDFIDELLPYPDYMKLRSSMTLFAQADPEEELFQTVINRFYNKQYDEQTLKLLKVHHGN